MYVSTSCPDQPARRCAQKRLRPGPPVQRLDGERLAGPAQPDLSGAGQTPGQWPDPADRRGPARPPHLPDHPGRTGRTAVLAARQRAGLLHPQPRAAPRVLHVGPAHRGSAGAAGPRPGRIRPPPGPDRADHRERRLVSQPAAAGQPPGHRVRAALLLLADRMDRLGHRADSGRRPAARQPTPRRPARRPPRLRREQLADEDVLQPLFELPRVSAWQGFAANGREHLAGVVAGQPARGEEYVGRRDLVRVSGTAHRRLLAELGHLVLVERGRDERCPHGARRYAVHPDAAFGQCLGERVGERQDRALGRCVIDQALVAAQAIDGRGVDDRPTVGQVPQRGLGRPEVAVDVYPECPLPLLAGQFREVAHGLLGGDVVDEHVQPAQFGHRVLDRVLAVLFHRQIAAERDTSPACLLHQLDRMLGILVLLFGQVGDSHVRALLGERDGDRPADPGVAAGDQGADPFEQAPAFVVAHLVLRLRRHLPGPARVLLLLLGRWLLSRWCRHEILPARAGARGPRLVAVPAVLRVLVPPTYLLPGQPNGMSGRRGPANPGPGGPAPRAGRWLS